MVGVAVVGMQWGDEGKGKIIDVMAEKADIVVRYQGGNNAGHTVVVGQEKFKFHLLPSGAVRRKRCMIGAGVVVDPDILLEEIKKLEQRGIKVKLTIDQRAHLILPYHKLMDGAIEHAQGKAAIGTTLRGIGPCYADRALRLGVRFCDLLHRNVLQKRLKLLHKVKKRELEALGVKVNFSEHELERKLLRVARVLKRYIGDVSLELTKAFKQRKYVLFEGAQGALLDNDFGSYPYVTSSHPMVSGAFIGTGITPCSISRVVGVVKAYSTRVGGGPFVTELKGKLAEYVRERGNEFGTTTGRPRRVGWLDLVVLRHAQRLNGATELAITKIDVLSNIQPLKVCVAYKLRGKLVKELPGDSNLIERCRPVYKEFDGFEFTGRERHAKEIPRNALKYVRFIERELGTKVRYLSVGAAREQTIKL
jgi:adenylosuccinate synthase